MHPMIRIAAVVAALAGAFPIGRALWTQIAGNLTASRSWSRTEGEVRGMNGLIEFELGVDPATTRVFAKVDHTWGLSLFHKAPLFLDPGDATRVKPAGFLQMWLAPAQLSGLLLVLFVAAVFAARMGSGNVPVEPHGQWMFTPAPGPLAGGISLHSPPRQWKIVLGWSLLGIAMAVIPLLNRDGSLVPRFGFATLGSAFALLLWGYALHTRSLEITANDEGMRMVSVLGWRHVPWGMVRGAEDQDIFTTYYNGNMRMWEMPFPGSTVRVISFNDERGRTLMSFSPELEPKDALHELFALCTRRTGAHLTPRKIGLPF